MKEITVEATTGNIPKVAAFVDEELERLDCAPKANMQIDVCIDELVANVAHYAYGSGTGDVTVCLGFDEEQRIFSLTFVDAGVPFDPCNVPEPDISLPLEERPIGGLGLLMVRKMMDEMRYRREGEHNVLTVYKRI